MPGFSIYNSRRERARAGQYLVSDFGAKGNGSTDDTSAIQAAIDAADAANGGEIAFGPGVYMIAGPARNPSQENSQILLPRRDLSSQAPISIRLRGPCPPILGPWDNGHAPMGGAILQSTMTTSGVSLIHSWSTYQFDAVPLAGIYCGVQDLTVRCPDNPAIMALNLGSCMSANVSSVLIDTPTYTNPRAQPTHSGSVGIILPQRGNAVAPSGRDIMVLGFYEGTRLGEHFTGDNINAFFCWRGVVFMSSYHGVNIGRIGTFYCKSDIFIDQALGPPPTLNVQQHDIETSDIYGWWTEGGYRLDDAGNKGIGRINWWTVYANTGAVNTYTTNGGSGLTLTRAGG